MKQNKNKKSYILPVLCVVFCAVLAVTVFALVYEPKSQKGEFTPPPFESAAVVGTPEVPENLGYSSPYKEGMSYRFSICGNVTLDGENAVVYLTNPKENEVWLKVRILDESGNVLGESGLLKPGEYVKEVKLKSTPHVGTAIKLKIMGYEMQTYQSAGSATLSTAIGEG